MIPWNRLWWDYLHHRNWQMLQIRAFFFPPRELRVKHFPKHPSTEDPFSSVAGVDKVILPASGASSVLWPSYVCVIFLLLSICQIQHPLQKRASVSPKSEEVQVAVPKRWWWPWWDHTLYITPSPLLCCELSRQTQMGCCPLAECNRLWEEVRQSWSVRGSQAPHRVVADPTPSIRSTGLSHLDSWSWKDNWLKSLPLLRMVGDRWVS